MVMMICPNCLISLFYNKNTCHQCGYKIDKRPVGSQEFLPRIRSFSKPIFLHKLKLKRPGKAKLTD